MIKLSLCAANATTTNNNTITTLKQMKKYETRKPIKSNMHIKRANNGNYCNFVGLFVLLSLSLFHTYI